MTGKHAAYPCPSCGFLTFDDGPGCYEICGTCGWQDDPVQLLHPLSGGANKINLVESQANVLAQYPLHVTELDGMARDPEWRPLRNDEHESIAPPETGLDYDRAVPETGPAYYWKVKK